MRSLRKRIYEVIEVSSDRKGLSWRFDIFLILLIALNALAIVLESVKPIREEYGDLFYWFELFSVVFFTIEYILRVWVAVENPLYKGKPFARLKFSLSSFSIIDLLAILPFYLTLLPIDLRFIRIFRLFRLFRLFKIARYVSAINAINQVFREKKDQLIVSLTSLFLMLLIVSSIMYFVENEAQPDAFSSIPETMWWGVATLTTVGYGDVYPVTVLGKILGGLIAILGIGLFALPTGILASGFSDALDKKSRIVDGEKCPCCGQQVHE